MDNNVIKTTTGIDILIVEDSLTQAEQLKYLLENHYYSVATAKNGRHALEVLEQYLPTIIITDICMPEMDGYELCKRVKAQDKLKDIPVIVLTALADPEDVVLGLECGADNFITKPYNEDYLLLHVAQIIANRKLNRNERVRFGLEIVFGNKRRFVTSDQQQMLSLLISTYEAAVMKNKELIMLQQELQDMKDQLEQMAEKRAVELNSNRE